MLESNITLSPKPVKTVRRRNAIVVALVSAAVSALLAIAGMYLKMDLRPFQGTAEEAVNDVIDGAVDAARKPDKK